MLNVCPVCRDPTVEKRVTAIGDGTATATCPECGHEYGFSHRPLYTIEGAPGSGKSTTAGRIGSDLPHVVVEGDAFVDLVGGELSWGAVCELSLRICVTVHAAGERALYVGGMYPRKLADCPETRYFSRIERCALVCSDEAYERRLRERPWYRAHPAKIDEHLVHNRWYREEGPGEGIEVVDTSAHGPAEVARRVRERIEKPEQS
jgi:hypothetical protein